MIAAARNGNYAMRFRGTRFRHSHGSALRAPTFGARRTLVR
jgi:hypothetical protein